MKADLKNDIAIPEMYLMVQKIIWSIIPVVLLYLLYKALR
jgi:hypothetical protein